MANRCHPNITKQISLCKSPVSNTFFWYYDRNDMYSIKSVVTNWLKRLLWKLHPPQTLQRVSCGRLCGLWQLLQNWKFSLGRLVSMHFPHVRFLEVIKFYPFWCAFCVIAKLNLIFMSYDFCKGSRNLWSSWIPSLFLSNILYTNYVSLFWRAIKTLVHRILRNSPLSLPQMKLLQLVGVRKWCSFLLRSYWLDDFFGGNVRQLV